jgi:hypothetical protein
MVSVVQQLNNRADPPGILLANTGQLYWWPQGKKALNPTSQYAVPYSSLVHHSRWHNPKVNCIPENETVAKHVQYVLEAVVPACVDEHASLDIVGVCGAADDVGLFLDRNWGKWKERVEALAIVGGCLLDSELKSSSFKDFMRAVSQLHFPICYENR